MTTVPAGGGLDDAADVAARCHPAKVALGAAGGRGQAGRIASAPRCLGDRNAGAEQMLDRLQNLTYRDRLAGPQVERPAAGGGLQEGEGGQMRLRQILDVDVVALAGAVARGVVD